MLGNTSIPLVIDNRKVRVERARVNRTLLVNKIPLQMTEKQLREIVEPFGTVEDVTIIKNFQTNKSKGFGFVKFVYREDAAEAFTVCFLTPRPHTSSLPFFSSCQSNEEKDRGPSSFFFFFFSPL